MFLALAITCDEYFVPSLEKICEVLGSLTSATVILRRGWFDYSKN